MWDRRSCHKSVKGYSASDKLFIFYEFKPLWTRWAINNQCFEICYAECKLPHIYIINVGILYSYCLQCWGWYTRLPYEGIISPEYHPQHCRQYVLYYTEYYQYSILLLINKYQYIQWLNSFSATLNQGTLTFNVFWCGKIKGVDNTNILPLKVSCQSFSSCDNPP